MPDGTKPVEPFDFLALVRAKQREVDGNRKPWGASVDPVLIDPEFDEVEDYYAEDPHRDHRLTQRDFI